MTSCGFTTDRYSDKSNVSTIYIENDSSHDIIVDWDVYRNLTFHTEVPKGERVKAFSCEVTAEDDDQSLNPAMMFPNINSADITYDDGVNHFCAGLYHEGYHRSMCDFENYEYARIEAYLGEFTYIFTDKDYDYAAQHQLNQ